MYYTVIAISKNPWLLAVRGCYITDHLGKQYLDGSGGAAVSCLGHGDKDVTESMKAQLDQIAFAHYWFFHFRGGRTAG